MAKAKARRSAAGAAMFEVMSGTLATFFRLRAAGKKLGAVSPWGGGAWGLLRSLKEGGPQTVPQLARARPVARQRIQTLADELAAAGFVAFTDNPAHRRSKLLRLTAKGEARFAELNERILDAAEQLASGMDAGELRKAAGVLAELRQRLERS